MMIRIENGLAVQFADGRIRPVQFVFEKNDGNMIYAYVDKGTHTLEWTILDSVEVKLIEHDRYDEAQKSWY